MTEESEFVVQSFSDETAKLTTDDRVDYVAAQVNVLNEKVDNALQGLAATYQRVEYLVNMLSAVQQVASGFPGMGKRISKLMEAQQAQGVNNNG
jgi:hypothetical protein